MGEWAIIIQGSGAHDNPDYPQDADKMAKQFVEDLKAAGHQIESATFTNSQRRAL
jgi:hypothetical protein